jgi:DNA-binding transcriptional regulator YdaS (Cro superfamily)
MIPRDPWALKGKIVTRFKRQILFAPVVSIHPTKLNMILNGHRPASKEEAENIARALGSTVGELFA